MSADPCFNLQRCYRKSSPCGYGVGIESIRCQSQRSVTKTILPSCDTWPWELGNPYVSPAITSSPSSTTPGLWGFVWRLINNGREIALSALPYWPSHGLKLFLEETIINEISPTVFPFIGQNETPYGMRWLEGDDGMSVYQVTLTKRLPANMSCPEINRDDALLFSHVGSGQRDPNPYAPNAHDRLYAQVFYVIVNYSEEYTFPNGDLPLSESYFRTRPWVSEGNPSPDVRDGGDQYPVFLAGLLDPYKCVAHVNHNKLVIVGGQAKKQEVMEMSGREVEWVENALRDDGTILHQRSFQFSKFMYIQPRRYFHLSEYCR